MNKIEAKQFEPDVIGKEDPKLTRMSKEKFFVINQRSGQVLSIYTIKGYNETLKELIPKYGKSNLKLNRYGDILILNH